MKGYVEKLERLGYVLPQDITVGLILNGLTNDFVGFVKNYNMHNIGKTIGEIHAMLIDVQRIENKAKMVAGTRHKVLEAYVAAFDWMIREYGSCLIRGNSSRSEAMIGVINKQSFKAVEMCNHQRAPRSGSMSG
ncbi:hypothetical protein Tco_1544125 [Tanacetum coccineum]